MEKFFSVAEAISPIFPLIAAIIISLTTLYIALYAYPIQKKEDRKNYLKKIQTELYQNYLKVLSDDIGYHADNAYKNNAELGYQQRYTVTRYRTSASIFASKRALLQMQVIAEKREGGEPFEDYINEIARFALIARNECLGDMSVVEKIPEGEMKNYLPFGILHE